MAQKLQLIRAADVTKHVATLNNLAQTKYYMDQISARDRIEKGFSADLIALSNENIELRKYINRMSKGQIMVEDDRPRGASVSSTGKAQLQSMSTTIEKLMKDLAETKKELANALMDASKNEKQCELLKKERDELERMNAA